VPFGAANDKGLPSRPVEANERSTSLCCRFDQMSQRGSHPTTCSVRRPGTGCAGSCGCPGGGPGPSASARRTPLPRGRMFPAHVPGPARGGPLHAGLTRRASEDGDPAMRQPRDLHRAPIPLVNYWGSGPRCGWVRDRAVGRFGVAARLPGRASAWQTIVGISAYAQTADAGAPRRDAGRSEHELEASGDFDPPDA